MKNPTSVIKKIPLICLILIFVLGIYLRTRVYLTNQSFWHDECALALNILNRNYLELFNPLTFTQVAPPMFLIYSKMLVNKIGNFEFVFRFIPYFASLLSIGAFFFLSKILFNTKKAILCANFLFAISFPLYYYSAEFKPVSFDVLFCVFTIYMFQNLNRENLFYYSLILSTFIWFSFPTAFLITAILILIGFNKNCNIKEKLQFFIPVIISSILFYIFYLHNIILYQKIAILKYWNSEFINLENYKFIFENANKFIFSGDIIFPILILFGIGLFLYEKNRFAIFALLSICLTIVASILGLYPFSGRLIVFLIPILIILVSKFVDFKKIIGYIVLAVFLYGAFPQINKTYRVIIKNNYNKKQPEPREMTKELKNRIKKNEVIYVNQASDSDYLYYKKVYDIKNLEYIATPNKIKHGNSVWFFLPNDAERTYKNIIENKYIIDYKNFDDNSALIHGIKIK